jgi:signal transduction histidine kinase
MDLKRILLLKKSEIFQNAAQNVLARLAEKLKEVPVAKDETLFFKGDRGHAMYIVESGSVKVHDGDHVFDILTEGRVFGEYSLIDTETRSASITGAEDSLLLSLNKGAFYNLILGDQEVLHGILQLMVARLRNLDIIQEELASKNKKIESQNSEIEDKNEELVDLNEEKNHLISIIAHDIRNPLSSATTFANLLKTEENSLTEDQNEYITHLIRSLDRITKMVGTILDVKAIDEKRANMHMTSFNASEEIRDMLGLHEERASKKNIQIVHDLDDFEVNLDQGLFRQVTENLVSNAVKFSPSDTIIQLRLQSNGESFEFSVRDQGPGFTEEDKELLYGKYAQLSAKPTGGEKSTGLGLSIVKKFTDQMFGKVWCESEFGHGAKFTVRFPIGITH